MASQVFEFAPVIPAGTPTTAPVTIALTMPVRIVRRIEVRVPPGPAGVMGFALGAAGQPVIPANSGAWVVTDDERITWDLDGQIESGAWQLSGYNTGVFAHTVYVRFLTDLPTVPAPAVAAPSVLPLADVSPTPDASVLIPPGPSPDLAGESPSPSDPLLSAGPESNSAASSLASFTGAALPAPGQVGVE